MIFTASDVESLSRSLARWECAEYAFAAFVAVACAGEYIANFTDLLTGGVEEAKKRLEKRSTLLLITALALELVCLVKTNSLSGMLVGSIRDKAEEADTKAKTALADAKTALVQSEAAKTSSSSAFDAASRVKGLADAAVVGAENAEAKVETLAKRAEVIRKEVNALGPRSLTLDQQQEIRDACPRFRGHNVSVFSYAGDGEGWSLGEQIMAALGSSGINIADARASGLTTGGLDVGIHLRGPNSEKPFMECLKQTLTSIGHLEVAPINDPIPRGGAGMSGGGQAFVPGIVFITVTVGVKPVPILDTSKNAANKMAK